MKIITRRSENTKFELNDRDILELLQKAEYISKESAKSAIVYVLVPGGGDWSNTALEIGTDTNIVITLQDSVSKPTEKKVTW